MTQAATLAQLASSGALYADTSGNVGIGTTSPNFNSVTGTVCHINNSTAGAWAINHYTNGTTGSAASDGLIVGNIAGDAYVFNYESSPLIFGTAATERMRIDASGNLLVGTTSSTNAAKVTAVSSSSSASYQMMMNNTDTGTGNQISMDIYRNSTRVGYITTTNTTTSFTSISDYRLKKDVVPMTNALAAVAQLKPCRYKWKSDGSDGQGFIAHELQAVVPDCVFGEKDSVNEDGSIKPQGIDTSFLVATLTAAIQELKAELDVCKAEIAALKGV
jgi:hypothetical protein